MTGVVTEATSSRTYICTTSSAAAVPLFCTVCHAPAQHAFRAHRATAGPLAWCAGCHAADAPDRHGAPEAFVFDTEGQVANHRWLIRDSVLESGRMPLGGGLPEAEAEILDLYLLCGLSD